jgi:outer membrane protein TolC
MKLRLCLLTTAIAGSLAAQPARGPLELSMRKAVDLAISEEGNARVKLANELQRQAEARSAQVRAALLPNLDASVSQQNTVRNLAALGVRFSIPGTDFQIPRIVGPFNIFDARVSATQSIFDFSQIRRYQSARAATRAASAEVESSRDQIAAQTAVTYLGAIRAEADVRESLANIELAEAILRSAENQKAAGTATGIEITRAQVQLADSRQRLLIAENARDRAQLQLLKIIGLPLDANFELTGRLEVVTVPSDILSDAEETAQSVRSDLKAQREREENARLSYSAARLDRLPSIAGFADYGSIGSSIRNALPTRTYGATLRIPIFDGGRRDARRAEAASQLREQQVRTADLREQVALEVRLSLDSLRSAAEQVKVAESGVELANQELAHARRRVEAGVASGLELTDAQTRLERARDNRIAALFNYNQARIDLGQATGTIRRMLQ